MDLQKTVRTREYIQFHLETMEKDYGIRILWAVEGGSLAWGMAGPDSDRDVRFVYARPVEDYLKLNEPKNTIEVRVGDALDISGWDIRKAMDLLRRSNPSIIEWMSSPVIYRHWSPVNELLELTKLRFNRKAFAHHYYNFGRTNYSRYIEDREEVVTKKYLHVVRPLLTILCMLRSGALPPIRMEQLMWEAPLTSEVREECLALLAAKIKGENLGLSKPNPVLNAWIEDTMRKWTTEGTFNDLMVGDIPLRRLDEIVKENILTGLPE